MLAVAVAAPAVVAVAAASSRLEPERLHRLASDHPAAVVAAVRPLNCTSSSVVQADLPLAVVEHCYHLRASVAAVASSASGTASEQFETGS